MNKKAIVLKVGDIVKVRVYEIDDQGRINLTHKEFEPDEKETNKEELGKLNGHIENCVVKELQKDSFGKVIHIDFQDIKKDEKIKMKIPVVFDGQSTLEGRQLLLEVLISEVELYGEADKLPENIKCNVGELNIGDKIFIKDLVIPEGMRLDVDENAIVATIADNSAVDTDEDQSEDGTESKQ